MTKGEHYTDNDIIIPKLNQGKMLWKDHAKLLKDRFIIPIFLAGNITSSDEIDFLLQENYADLVLLGRSLLAKPDIVNDMLQNRNHTIDYLCKRCNNCKYHSRGLLHIFCQNNSILKEID